MINEVYKDIKDYEGLYQISKTCNGYKWRYADE